MGVHKKKFTSFGQDIILFRGGYQFDT